jgi:hypothetical protein
VTSAPIEAKTGVCTIELKGNNLELSYALANRSAVFFHQKHYDLCLKMPFGILLSERIYCLRFYVWLINLLTSAYLMVLY